MNAVEIEEAISDLALQPFDAAEFPFAFLAAFGNKDTALKRLRTGNNNASDVPGGVLQRNNIHIAVCEAGAVGETIKALRASPATIKAKAKFILATDGQTLEAEELAGGETIACAYPDWARDERRADMNHFMARLVFCFFAEDTDIFNGEGLFTHTIEQMSERDGANTHEVMSEIFRAMNTPIEARRALCRSEFIPTGDVGLKPDLPLRSWADQFPYVNGGLFAGSTEVPRFTRMARIRAFDPACGSGNFLVIAYKQMREIEAEINRRRGELHLRSEIPLTNFRGIELRDFPAEIARLALIIAELQCDVLYRGQKDALAEFLPLDAQNWIVCGNALRLDWLSICPPTGMAVKVLGDDLFSALFVGRDSSRQSAGANVGMNPDLQDQVAIDFANEGDETYIIRIPRVFACWDSAQRNDCYGSSVRPI